MSEKVMSDQLRAKLDEWKAKYEAAEVEYSAELAAMDVRERLYAGEEMRIPIVKGEVLTGDRRKDIPHLRNICAELVEDQVDSSIPMPKVTSRKPGHEERARLIESMLRNKLDLLPFERINDLMERMVPIQGGGIYRVEWDQTKSTHETLGEIVVTPLHPKWVIPQDGIYEIADMDYIFVRIPTTKATVERRYGVDLGDYASEEMPEIRTADGDSAADGVVTQIVAYYRNEDGGIGKFSWAVDTVLEDFDDYQARRNCRCAECGAKVAGDVCEACGSSKIEEVEEDEEEVWEQIVRIGMPPIPGAEKRSIVIQEDVDRTGLILPVITDELVPTMIPYYKPDVYPLVLQRNVSVYGKFLGDSDVEKVASQQNTINRLEKKIIDKLIETGSYISLPPDCAVEVSDEDMKVIRLNKVEEREYIGVYSMEAPVAQDMQYLAQVYEEGKQIVGITDAFLGRYDSSAKSGRAKQISAGQAAGRLESKAAMKRAAYADLFELMFKFVLAYADEPFPVISKDEDGNVRYDSFSRYDFLDKDDAGEWYWDDAYLFDVDASGGLAADRESMWQELRNNLTSGALGDPTSAETLAMFWGLMEEQHYPGAGAIRKRMEELKEQQAQAQAQAQAMAAQQQMMAQQYPGGTGTVPQGMM